jgi:hypothetical protein
MSGEYYIKDGSLLSELMCRRLFKANIEPRKPKFKYTGSRKALRELKKQGGENDKILA